MSKKPASDAAIPTMDYAQHDATWNLFVNVVKWGVIACAVLVVALYIVINP